ncbi:hypothetical protein ILUMI_16182 [Ignelater luminosus]|uniref:Uncharacterized protein n=1 Tax=Ignelater luminosus TaxID=2038154 RepID=A0A8K0CRQ4_IGNLU|nr:hypothetical protein ILUMI_16182 [Ignelater luminosus]
MNAKTFKKWVEEQPHFQSRRTIIDKWLYNNNIQHDSTSFKSELLGLGKTNKKEKVYEVDELIRMWAQVKKYYDDYGYQNDKIITMWNEALNHCNDKLWHHCVNHTEDIVKAWYERQRLLDVTVNSVVINITNDSSDSSGSDGDNDP